MYNNANRKSKVLPAKLAVKEGPCAFCCRELNDETLYGKLYEIGDIYCHYFCVLLSCCLIQKGKDEDGLFGFLYPDILAEIARSKKHKCSYCGRDGASLGCSVSQCKKQFHLPCGRERNAVSMFYGNYKTFCEKHAPKQNISDTIMNKVKSRMAKKRKNLKKVNKETEILTVKDDECVEELLCMICCEAVDGSPTVNTFWPPCCGRDAWFHRSCLERMALSAGAHYLKCPLCNDKESFHEALLQQGYYVPDRDAAWELEQNAFSEIYERTFSCGLPRCVCPDGRRHDADTGPWDINVCVLCGSAGAHARCREEAESQKGAESQVNSEAQEESQDGPEPYVCASCAPSAASAPHLIQALHELALKEQQASAEAERVVRPLMPSRMSLRRTKRRADIPSGSMPVKTEIQTVQFKQEVTDTELSRRELNLKTPRLPEGERSPIRLLQQGLCERGYDLQDSDLVLGKFKEKLGKPKPFRIKRRIVDNILEELMNTIYKDKSKTKAPVREWHSPKKYADVKEQVNGEIINCIQHEELKDVISVREHVGSDTKPKTILIENDSSMEISNGKDMVNIDLVTMEGTRGAMSPDPKTNLVLKFSPSSDNRISKTSIDMESFKTQYLHEVFCNKSPEVNERKRKLDEEIDTKVQEDPTEHDTWKRKRHKKQKNIKIKLKKRKQKMLKKEKRESRKKRSEKKSESPRVLKQYVLKYDGENDLNHIVRPSNNVTMKRKYVRKEKVVDHLKQTSLDTFFLQFK